MALIQNIDSSILYFMQDHVQNHFLNLIMIFITNLGNMGLIWILIAIALLFTNKFRKVGILMLCALVINTILGEVILKHMFQRPRPFNTLQHLDLLIKKPQSYSFPSGHTSSAFACAVILAYYVKKAAVPSIILACLIAFSRVYLTVHYPSDVLAGIVLGIISAMITIYLHKLYRKRYNKKKYN